MASSGGGGRTGRIRDRALTIDILSTLSRLATSARGAASAVQPAAIGQPQQAEAASDGGGGDSSGADSQSLASESSVEGSHTNLAQLSASAAAASNGGVSHRQSQQPQPQLPLSLRRKSSIRKEWRRSPSISNSYADEWDRMFLSHGEGDLLLYLKELCLGGELRNCRFRSVVWRLALRVLSSDAARWKEETLAWRQRYTSLKQEHCIDISKLSTAAAAAPSSLSSSSSSAASSSSSSAVPDLQVHNPLSLDTRSPWYRFFRSEETRNIIYQDVRRTFPEIQYFHMPEVQEKMISTLFCFAHTSPLLYRQGMHEVLAPLLFVLHSDQLAFQHACELYSVTPPVMDMVGLLLDPQFLEHDAFAMFTQIMTVIEPWYTVSEQDRPVGRQAIESQIPFARPAEERSGNAIIEQLVRISESILRVHDLELYLHLEKLDVAPHIYGIRWMRLLFGREFPLQDLLVVWDAIFADGNDANFGLVDYMFVAMLVSIRSLLLASDFSTALTYLMRYPQGADVNFVVALAYHLRAPDVYPKPAPTGYQGLYMQKRRRHHRGAAASRYHTVGIDTSALRAAIQRIGSQESLQQQQQQGDLPQPSASSVSLFSLGGNEQSARAHSVSGQQHQDQQQSVQLRQSPPAAREHRPRSLIFGVGGDLHRRDSAPVPQERPMKVLTAAVADAVSAAEPSASAPVTPLDAAAGSSSGAGYLPRSHIRYRASRRQRHNSGSDFVDFAEITLPDERLARRRQTEALVAMCRACGDSVQATVRTLQSCCPAVRPVEQQRRIEQCLASLKHVRDLLHGKLAFDPAVMTAAASSRPPPMAAMDADEACWELARRPLLLDASDGGVNGGEQQQQQQQLQQAAAAAAAETEMTPVPTPRPVFTFADDS